MPADATGRNGLSGPLSHQRQPKTERASSGVPNDAQIGSRRGVRGETPFRAYFFLVAFLAGFLAAAFFLAGFFAAAFGAAFFAVALVDFFAVFFFIATFGALLGKAGLTEGNT